MSVITTSNLKCCINKPKSSAGFIRKAEVLSAVFETSRFVF